MGTIQERQNFSDSRFEELRQRLDLAATMCADKACIYATGSFGRREASEFSDIDVFIVSLDEEGGRYWLTRLEQIQVKAELIKATRELHFPPFSGDGKFLQHHDLPRLVEATGTEQDDATNTFTARLLLLLESRALIGSEVHQRAVDNVIADYWTEFPGRDDRFMPAYLSNDILRYWRTLCLNYEARTSETTPEKQAKRRLANYKLKHSRLLTCYSALLYLLNTYVKHRSVTMKDAQDMVGLTPISRVQSVFAGSKSPELVETLHELLGQYERFLSVTNAAESNLIARFSDKEERRNLRGEQSHFGDLVYKALRLIGEGDRFFRRLVV